MKLIGKNIVYLGLLIAFLGLNLLFVNQVNSVSTISMQRSKIYAYYAVCTDTLLEHKYDLWIGMKWKRVNDWWGDDFYSADTQYDDNLDSSPLDKPGDWHVFYQGWEDPEKDDEVWGSATTYYGWGKPQSSQSYRLCIWMRIGWCDFMGWHHAYDRYRVKTWSWDTEIDHEFVFDGDYGGADFRGAVKLFFKICS